MEGIEAALSEAEARPVAELETCVLRDVVLPCARELVARYSA
jgi:hypothetical protein